MWLYLCGGGGWLVIVVVGEVLLFLGFLGCMCEWFWKVWGGCKLLCWGGVNIGVVIDEGIVGFFWVIGFMN